MRAANLFSALLLLAALTGTHATAADSRLGADEPPEASEAISQADEQAILGIINAYSQGFIAGDEQGLLNLWDERYAQGLTYVGAELDAPLLGLEALRGYYNALATYYNVYRGDISQVLIRRDGNVAYAYCFIFWEYAPKGVDKRTTFLDRATFVLRKRGNQWRLQHLHESVKWMPTH
jgi:hypothetical protein